MNQENKGVKSNEVCKLCLHQECLTCNQCHNINCYLFGKPSNYCFDAILSHPMNNTQKEEEKPKCESCYDKGYYTQMYNTIGSEDFGGEGFETGSKIHKIPCRECNRVKNITCDCKECIPQPPESKEECKHIFDWGKYMDSCVCRFCKLFLSSDEYIELKNRELLKKGIFTQCESCLTRKHIDCCSDGCQCSCKIAIKNPSESLEEKGEMKLEDCQVCEQYICKCPVKEFTPPTDSKLNQEYNNK